MKSIPEVHIVQTPEWGEFKAMMGTCPVRVGNVQFTKHSIPVLPFYVGYAPRVNFEKQKFSWTELKTVAKREKCVVVRFDVPNMLKGDLERQSIKSIIVDIKKYCRKSPRSTFAKWNVLLDISQNEEDLIQNMHQKTRYNTRLAQKRGVIVKEESNDKGFDIFYQLHKETADRQKFLPHSKNYYQKAFFTMKAHGKAHILIAYFEEKPLVAWMLFNNQKTLYYPYGGSSQEHRNLMPSNLIAWEAIKLGKRLGCTTFDMWGATNDPKDPWWGFTDFKLKYGGQLVEYIDSYDFVINPPIYYFFNLAYSMFWKLQNYLRR